ncbi:hypothetical protein [Actinokineospora iranica]|nr:hypothetical protein [Actinokineospora iranica]
MSTLVESDPSAYAGVYYVEAGNVYHVNVAAHAPQSALNMIAGLVVQGGDMGLVVHRVPHSTAELRETMREFVESPHWTERLGGSPLSWGLDPVHNRVVVGVAEKNAALDGEVRQAYGDKIFLEQQERFST